jgi:hypothetical protein
MSYMGHRKIGYLNQSRSNLDTFCRLFARLEVGPLMHYQRQFVTLDFILSHPHLDY